MCDNIHIMSDKLCRKGFICRFTFKELMYFWFSKKKCPQCKQKMVRKKTYEMKKGKDCNSLSDPFFSVNADVKEYKFSYYCLNCDKSHTLAELALKK